MSICRPTMLVALAALLAGTASGHAAEPLPALGVDASQSSVSGISSGAYMAGQFHLAFSTTVVGAGVVAGGRRGAAPRTAVATRCCSVVWTMLRVRSRAA
jgi:hypothetical protein